MKIYMVIADNGWNYEEHRWWNVDAFVSKEAAQEYIRKLPSIIDEKDNRFDELDILSSHRELTDFEKREHQDLCEKWTRYWHFFDRGYFIIEEHEIRE